MHSIQWHLTEGCAKHKQMHQMLFFLIICPKWKCNTLVPVWVHGWTQLFTKKYSAAKHCMAQILSSMLTFSFHWRAFPLVLNLNVFPLSIHSYLIPPDESKKNSIQVGFISVTNTCICTIKEEKKPGTAKKRRQKRQNPHQLLKSKKWAVSKQTYVCTVLLMGR